MSLLPTSKQEPITDWTQFTVLIHSASGVGKTTFISGIDDQVLLVDTEGGSRLQRVHVSSVQSWGEFKRLAAEFLEGKHAFRVFAIDTIGPLIKMCVKHCVEKMGIEHPSDGAYGKAYDAIKNEWNQQILTLQQSKYGIWLSAHTVTRAQKTPLGERDFSEPNLPGYLQDFVIPYCDFVFMAIAKETHLTDKDGKLTGKKKQERILYTKPTEYRRAKDRLRYAPLPDEIPLEADKFMTIFQHHLEENRKLAP